MPLSTPLPSTPAEPAELAAGLAASLPANPPEQPAADPRLARLPQLFRDSRAAGEVHPLEHLVRRYFTGDRA